MQESAGLNHLKHTCAGHTYISCFSGRSSELLCKLLESVGLDRLKSICLHMLKSAVSQAGQSSELLCKLLERVGLSHLKHMCASHTEICCFSGWTSKLLCNFAGER